MPLWHLWPLTFGPPKTRAEVRSHTTLKRSSAPAGTKGSAPAAPFSQLWKWNRCQLEFPRCPALNSWLAEALQDGAVHRARSNGCSFQLRRVLDGVLGVTCQGMRGWRDTSVRETLKHQADCPLKHSQHHALYFELYFTQWSYKCHALVFRAAQEHRTVHLCVGWKKEMLIAF